MIKQLLIFCFLALSAAVLAPTARADVSMLIYHRFGEDSAPSTNITTEQLEAHIAAIQTGNYQLLTLEDLEAILKAGAPSPERGLIITVDDAYRSFKTVAWPRFKAANIPVTLFVATDPVDAATRTGLYLTWEEIRELQKDGVTIGHHGASHEHLARMPFEEAKADIERATEVFERELGMVPDTFAYPYGEFDQQLAEHLEESGFRLATAQYSSAIDARTAPYALPRFPMNERYGDMARFNLIANALALPVKDVLPRDPKIAPEKNPPYFGFTLTEPIRDLDAMQCYPSHLGAAAEIRQLKTASEDLRIEVRFKKPFPKGRSRINCTLRDRSGRWYWFGRPFFVPGGPLN